MTTYRNTNAAPADTNDRDGTSLSVERIFLVLEALSLNTRPQTLTEIAETLSLPKSSLLKLLKGLSRLGYIIEDPSAKTYFPSSRICVLSSRIEALLIGHPSHLEMLNQIRDATGETVGLGAQHGSCVGFHNCIGGPQELSLNLSEGRRYPLHQAAAGRVLLATMDEPELKRIARRLSLDHDQPDLTYAHVKALTEETRRQGFGMTAPGASDAVASLAMLVPNKIAPKPLAVSVGGPIDRIHRRQDEILSVMKEVLASYYSLSV